MSKTTKTTNTKASGNGKQLIAMHEQTNKDIEFLKEKISTYEEKFDELLKIINELSVKIDTARLQSSTTKSSSRAAATTASSKKTPAKTFPGYSIWARSTLVADENGEFEKYVNSEKFETMLEEQRAVPANKNKSEEALKSLSIQKYITTYLSARPKDKSEVELQKKMIEEYEQAKSKFKEEDD